MRVIPFIVSGLNVVLLILGQAEKSAPNETVKVIIKDVQIAVRAAIEALGNHVSKTEGPEQAEQQVYNLCTFRPEGEDIKAGCDKDGKNH